MIAIRSEERTIGFALRISSYAISAETIRQGKNLSRLRV